MSGGQEKVKVRALYQLGAWLAFLMLGYLGIRAYKTSMEKLKTDAVIDEVFEIMYNTKELYRNQGNYGELDYRQAVLHKLIPKKMFKNDDKEAVNPYGGGIDIFYSATEDKSQNTAFEVSYQGLTSDGCINLLRTDWGRGEATSLIAIAGYPTAQPAGLLNAVYPWMTQEDIKNKNIFKGSDARFMLIDKIESACDCNKDTCTVIWKFY